MVRTADTDDLEALVELRCARYGDSPADAAGWLQNVAGLVKAVQEVAAE